MDATIFFKNGDPSEPRLNAEGSFTKPFAGSFSDEKSMGFIEQEEPKFNLTTDEILNRVKDSVKETKDEASNAIADALKSTSQSKISTGAWIAIGVTVVAVFGGLGYILYKKYK